MKQRTGLMIAAAIGAWALFGRGGGGPTIRRLDGTTVGPGGVIRDARGRIVGQLSPQEYARAVARNGQAMGMSAGQIVGSVATIGGLAASFYRAAERVLTGTPTVKEQEASVLVTNEAWEAPRDFPDEAPPTSGEGENWFVESRSADLDPLTGLPLGPRQEGVEFPPPTADWFGGDTGALEPTIYDTRWGEQPPDGF